MHDLVVMAEAANGLEAVVHGPALRSVVILMSQYALQSPSLPLPFPVRELEIHHGAGSGTAKHNVTFASGSYGTVTV